MKRIIPALIMGLLLACHTERPDKTIRPGEMIFDTDGNAVNAHGGGIMYHDGLYYWYGEYKGDSTYRLDWVDTWECWRADAGGVSCYSSPDLLNWTFEGVVLPVEPNDTSSELHPSQVIERPKVIYNDQTGQFVMWMHIESPDYEKAHAGVAISESPVGPFRYLGSMKPNGGDSRDMTIFKDDDGRAYIIHASEWNKTLYIGLLDSTYTSTTGRFTRNFENLSREAPAVFKHEGKYYMLTSGCTGWDPNIALWAVADSMLGEWKIMDNPCVGPDSENTFYAQSTFVLPVNGQPNSYIAMFDRWNKTDLVNSTYVWLPLVFEGGRPVVQWVDEWTPSSMQYTSGNKLRRLSGPGPARPLVVYNNWSAYDELSDTIPLTEQLSLKMLDEVLRLKKHGVEIDAYLMDAFWFDVDGGYRKWHRNHWPEGPEEWIKKCKENDIIPGLWFSTNLITSGGSPLLNPVPEWEESIENGSAIASLSHGGYLPHLMETLQQYADMGIGIFKFDFAYFDASTPEIRANYTPDEIIENNKEAFYQALKAFREKNPDILLIAYNGFGLEMEDTMHEFKKTVDPRWLEVFDTMYSGDPRVSDVPMSDFWRSVDVYSDQMVREAAFNGIPIDRIDNCSFMTGTTGTCYKRGLANWKSSLILTMARGGWMNIMHGDLEGFSGDDADWIAKAQSLYLPMTGNGSTSFIGGIPGKEEAYGYLTERAQDKLITLVNPSQATVRYMLPFVTSLDSLNIIFADSSMTAADRFGHNEDGYYVVLRPEEMIVLGTMQVDLGVENEEKKFSELTPIKYTDTVITPSGKKVTVLPPLSSLKIVIKQSDEKGCRFRSWGGGEPDGHRMDEYFRITATQDNDTIPVSISYDRVLWSGLSWAVGEIDADMLNTEKPVSITCSVLEGNAANTQIDIYQENTK